MARAEVESCVCGGFPEPQPCCAQQGSRGCRPRMLSLSITTCILLSRAMNRSVAFLPSFFFSFFFFYFFFLHYAKNFKFLSILGCLINEVRVWASGPHPALVLCPAGNSMMPQNGFFGASEELAIISLLLRLSGSINAYLLALGLGCWQIGSRLP